MAKLKKFLSHEMVAIPKSLITTNRLSAEAKVMMMWIIMAGDSDFDTNTAGFTDSNAAAVLTELVAANYLDKTRIVER